MGMRRNIKLEYSDSNARHPETEKKENVIYLYTHWGAEGLEDTLAMSLNRGRERWGDEDYLARIIFTDMTADVGSDLTGFGLAPHLMDDEFPTLVVDLVHKRVNGVDFEEFIANPSMFAI